jgi:hypothetical protein
VSWVDMHDSLCFLTCMTRFQPFITNVLLRLRELRAFAIPKNCKKANPLKKKLTIQICQEYIIFFFFTYHLDPYN